MNMRIDISRTAFDFDGVVVDIVTPFLRLVEERYGYGGYNLEDVTDFNLEATLRLPGDVVGDVVDDLIRRPLELGALPLPGAREALTGLAREWPLLIVTSRPWAEPVRAWFESLMPKLPGDRLEIIATGDPAGKLEHLRERNVHYFVEDNLETCRQLDEAGLCPLVFDQPWNRTENRLPRVSGWSELAPLFQTDRARA